MSKEMVIHYWCDNAKVAGHLPRSTEGDTIMVYDRQHMKVVEIDICDPCLSDMTDSQMQALAITLGRDPVVPELDPELCCPLIECSRHLKPFKDKAGKARHMTRTHPEWVAEDAA
jgi:hypothetical protein